MFIQPLYFVGGTKMCFSLKIEVMTSFKREFDYLLLSAINKATLDARTRHLLQQPADLFAAADKEKLKLNIRTHYLQ